MDLLDLQLHSLADDEFLFSDIDTPRPVKSHLNKLITAATDVVVSSNNLPTDLDYSVTVNCPEFSSKMSELSTLCSKTISGVEKVFKTMGVDDSINVLSCDVLDALCEEIGVGLNVHRSDSSQTVSSFRRQAKKKKAHKSSATSAENAAVDRCPAVNLNKRLRQLSLDIRADSYKRVQKHRQHQWSDLIDNFSFDLLRRPNVPKFNPIQPSVSIGKPLLEAEASADADLGHDHKFVPILCPRFGYLNAVSQSKGSAAVLPHPYVAELNALEWSDTEQEHSHRGRKILGGGSLLNINVNARGPSGPLNGCTMVQTMKDLEAMISQLKECDVIAIDVEHYNGQSYRGFVCLVQISGGDTDWVVDPFGIFGEMWRLNEVTTDPCILKVMHGAESDVLWLQRDFGVYIVNMFDTLKAAEVCCVSGGHSLSSLLKNLMGVSLDKSYQLADWRIRPIPSGMLNYAAADTHYLIALYNVLKNRALELDSIGDEEGVSGCADYRVQRIMMRSRGVCLRQYRERSFDSVACAIAALRKNGQEPAGISYLSFNILVNVMSLRNYAARVLDESETFLLPDYACVILALAGSSGNTAEKFLRAAQKHMSLLDREIPYVVSLRNNLKDAITLLDSSKVVLSCPIRLCNVEEFVSQGSVKVADKRLFPSGGNEATIRAPTRVPQTRSRSASYIYNNTNPDSVRSALAVYTTLSGGEAAGPRVAPAKNSHKRTKKSKPSTNVGREEPATAAVAKDNAIVSSGAKAPTEASVTCKAEDVVTTATAAQAAKSNGSGKRSAKTVLSRIPKGPRRLRRLENKRGKGRAAAADTNTAAGNKVDRVPTTDPRPVEGKPSAASRRRRRRRRAAPSAAATAQGQANAVPSD